MIFDYNYIIIIDKDKKSLSNELKYIGNFRIPYPEDYFFSDIASYSNSKFNFLSEMDADALLNEVITSYENNNLEKDRLFDKIEAEKENFGLKH